MIFYLIGALVAFFILIRLAPTQHFVYASRAVARGGRIRRPWAAFGPVLDSAGKRVLTRGKFLGTVGGHSMEHEDMPCGARMIGDYLDDKARKDLRPGDIVVVDAPAAYAPTGLRLRRIAAIENETVTFRPSADGSVRRSRPLSEMAVKINYVVD